MKTCSKCQLSKPNSEFHKCKINPDGLYQWCKKCKKEYDSQYRQSERIQNLYHSKEYRIMKRKYIDDNYIDRRLSSIKSRVKSLNNGIEFSITKEDIVFPDKCPLLGIDLIYSVKGRAYREYYNSVSIDRIDNTKGYIPGNVWVISRLANTMKSCATIDELITFSNNILKYFKKE